ncbi:hypothetical protein HAX54_028952 [Datura stramonium]|uniref:Uncharacterized protein n=1 Tax=Datura stramonium TaxID=4076 RepID=A0ABS8V6H0_DATST|nr:hypothetical protein [Datura stramonium]
MPTKKNATASQRANDSADVIPEWSEVHYNITSSDESLVRTTRAKSKAQEVIAATTSPPQPNEGSDKSKSNGDNPPIDNVGKGNDDAAQSGEGDTNAEESSDKDSGAEESNEQGEDYGITPEARTTEYDYRMGAMKGIRKLSTEDKMLHFQWMANIIAEDKERAERVTGIKPIYKASLNFMAISWWSIVRHCLVPTVNDNALSADKEALVACIMS